MTLHPLLDHGGEFGANATDVNAEVLGRHVPTEIAMTSQLVMAQETDGGALIAHQRIFV